MEAQRQLRSFIEREPQKHKQGFNYSVKYAAELQKALMVRLVS